MIKEDKVRKQNHRAMIVATQAANLQEAQLRVQNMQQNGVSDLNSDKVLAARKIEVEAKLQEWEKEKEKEKKRKMKFELDKMIKDRANQRANGIFTEETLKQLKLDKSEINKLLLQEKSPSKYQNEGHAMLQQLTENMYRKQQQNKVK